MKSVTFKMVLGLLICSTLLVACKREEEIIDGNAKFRLVNAFQGSQSQDFYQGDTKISTTAIAYGEASDYLTVKAGASTVAFKSANTQDVSASGSIGINNDISYTVFYAKNSTGVGEITGYPETNTAPPAGKAGVRFVNLGAALTSAVLVSFSTGEPITNSLGFGNITGYAVLDPTAELKFSLLGSVNSAIIPAATFQGGKLYTVWFDAANTTTAQYHVVAQN
ncbi:MAG: DUF4397 domain-containing protein [Bacteroidia bacterium]